MIRFLIKLCMLLALIPATVVATRWVVRRAHPKAAAASKSKPCTPCGGQKKFEEGLKAIRDGKAPLYRHHDLRGKSA